MKEGLAFQKKVHKELSEFHDKGTILMEEPWIRYSDTYGSHWCQPDSVLVMQDRCVVVESKLSLRRMEAGLVQLRKLYKPVLAHIFELPVVMVLAFKHWTKTKDFDLFVIDELEEAVEASSFKEPFAYHTLV